jgi:hypothetical protein
LVCNVALGAFREERLIDPVRSRAAPEGEASDGPRGARARRIGR